MLDKITLIKHYPVNKKIFIQNFDEIDDVIQGIDNLEEELRENYGHIKYAETRKDEKEALGEKQKLFEEVVNEARSLEILNELQFTVNLITSEKTYLNKLLSIMNVNLSKLRDKNELYYGYGGCELIDNLTCTWWRFKCYCETHKIEIVENFEHDIEWDENKPKSCQKSLIWLNKNVFNINFALETIFLACDRWKTIIKNEPNKKQEFLESILKLCDKFKIITENEGDKKQEFLEAILNSCDNFKVITKRDADEEQELFETIKKFFNRLRGLKITKHNDNLTNTEHEYINNLLTSLNCLDCFNIQSVFLSCSKLKSILEQLSNFCEEHNVMISTNTFYN